MGMRKTTPLYYLSLTAFVIWTLLIGIASYLDISAEKQQTIELAKKEALTILNKDIALRHWGAMHGGVYVPISEYTPSSPYLNHIPDRDITTPSGKKLTLMNPAYILRQVMAGYANLYQIGAHLTSLNALNPVNEPDEWERSSLAELEAGASEVFGVDHSAKEPSLRLIQPLITQLSCLKCHARQGYKEGDIRGAISISLPLGPYLRSEQQEIRSDMFKHLLFWLAGSLLLLIITFWGRKKIIEHNEAAEALRKKELDFRAIFNNSPIPMVIVDKENDIQSVNKKFTKLFGYTCDDISTADKWWNTAYPDPAYREIVKTDWRNAIAEAEASGEEIATQVWDLICKDGARRTSEFNLMPLADVSVITMNDITERKRTEEALRKSEEHYKEAQQIAHIGHWELDIINNELFWSEESYKIFEMDPEKPAPSYQLFLVHIHPDDRDRVAKAYTDSVINKKPYNIIHRILLDGERVKYVQERCRTEYNEAGEAVRSIGTVQDITEQQHAEETRILLGTAIEQTEDCIVVTDVYGNIQYVNPSFERNTGYSSEEVVGKNPRILKSGRQDPDFYQKMWVTLSSGEVWKGHLINRKKDGSLFEEEATISPIFDNNGEISNYVAVKRDVTEVLDIEKKLQQSQKMEAIGTLAGGIAHDFNNLLTIILGYTDMVREEAGPESAISPLLDAVTQAGTRAVEMVQQILTFSRQIDDERGPLQIHLLVKETLKLLRSTLPSTIEVKQDIDPECGFVESEAGKINQLVMNLCTNAYHAMRKSGGVLTVTLHPIRVDFDDEILNEIFDFIPGDYVELVVKDTGLGIDRTIIDKIFDPYFSTKELGDGTGLGLAVVHGVVKSHGGHIRVVSEPGEGTEFHVYLPQMTENDLLEAEERPAEEFSGPLRGNERILVVDDENMLATLEKMLLESLGYVVEAFFDSKEALRAFKERPDDFDLIVTDMTMPGMTGEELSEEIYKIRPDIPIILCTGFSELIDQEKAKQLGINKFLTKPVSKEELAKAIRESLDK
jgi:PAS domain S-box-containing protein